MAAQERNELSLETGRESGRYLDTFEELLEDYLLASWEITRLFQPLEVSADHWRLSWEQFQAMVMGLGMLFDEFVRDWPMRQFAIRSWHVIACLQVANGRMLYRSLFSYIPSKGQAFLMSLLAADLFTHIGTAKGWQVLMKMDRVFIACRHAYVSCSRSRSGTRS